MPEDVAGGLKRAIDLSWRSPVRLCILIADAPCHGSIYHTSRDNYPNGCPKNLDPAKLLYSLQVRLIQAATGAINEATSPVAVYAGIITLVSTRNTSNTRKIFCAALSVNQIRSTPDDRVQRLLLDQPKRMTEVVLNTAAAPPISQFVGCVRRFGAGNSRLSIKMRLLFVLEDP